MHRHPHEALRLRSQCRTVRVGWRRRRYARRRGHAPQLVTQLAAPSQALVRIWGPRGRPRLSVVELGPGGRLGGIPVISGRGAWLGILEIVEGGERGGGGGGTRGSSGLVAHQPSRGQSGETTAADAAAEAIAAARSGTCANASSPSAVLNRHERTPSMEAREDERAGPVASPRAHKNRTAPVAERSLLLAHHGARAAQRPVCLH